MNNQPTIQKNHMDILWHEFADKSDTTPITGTSLPAKASVIGRVGFMMLADIERHGLIEPGSVRLVVLFDFAMQLVCHRVVLA